MIEVIVGEEYRIERQHLLEPCRNRMKTFSPDERHRRSVLPKDRVCQNASAVAFDQNAAVAEPGYSQTCGGWILPGGNWILDWQRLLWNALSSAKEQLAH